MKELNRLINEFNSIESEYMDKITDEFAKGIKEYFEQYEILDGIRWCQYIPGFNDGDACEFSLTDGTFKFKESDEFIDEYALDYDYVDGKKVFNDTDSLIKSNIMDIFNEILHNMPYNVLQNKYGDNVEIIFNRGEEISIEYYDCGY